MPGREPFAVGESIARHDFSDNRSLLGIVLTSLRRCAYHSVNSACVRPHCLAFRLIGEETLIVILNYWGLYGEMPSASRGSPTFHFLFLAPRSLPGSGSASAAQTPAARPRACTGISRLGAFGLPIRPVFGNRERH